MTPAPDAAARAALAQEIAAGRRIGVAVSGGGDSMALLAMLGDAVGAEALAVVTVDHGLRAASRAEAEAVGATCRRTGLRHDILAWEGWDGAGNLQARARAARYALIATWARERGIGIVTLGHTRDDVAETLLMGLARSAGLDGLCGIRPRFDQGGVSFLRPLLHLSRAELRVLLTERGIDWIDDPSNDDERFDRVRLRRALAVLETCGIAAARLAASAGHLADDRQAIREHLSTWARHHVRQECGALCIDRGAFERLAPSLARRLVAAGLRWTSGVAYAPRSASIAALSSRQAGTLCGCIWSAGSREVRIMREPAAAARSPSEPLGRVWDGRWRVVGPDLPGARIAALGERGITLLPRTARRLWPRPVLAAGPAIWAAETLIAAPLAGLGRYGAELAAGRDDFVAALLSY